MPSPFPQRNRNIATMRADTVCYVGKCKTRRLKYATHLLIEYCKVPGMLSHQRDACKISRRLYADNRIMPRIRSTRMNQLPIRRPRREITALYSVMDIMEGRGSSNLRLGGEKTIISYPRISLSREHAHILACRWFKCVSRFHAIRASALI